eukprot:TRINITY_DN2446_c0_g1_i1.p1 TRINITY_DN2446_c0_g1~~TRINITY_DN2446_c0_g1_i1.p1  ORF type:complete len:381 (+),score=91.47 TRINITY_DN2446_c0_g1_i1:57-1199(+)
MSQSSLPQADETAQSNEGQSVVTSSSSSSSSFSDLDALANQFSHFTISPEQEEEKRQQLEDLLIWHQIESFSEGHLLFVESGKKTGSITVFTATKGRDTALVSEGTRSAKRLVLTLSNPGDWKTIRNCVTHALDKDTPFLSAFSQGTGKPIWDLVREGFVINPAKLACDPLLVVFVRFLGLLREDYYDKEHKELPQIQVDFKVFATFARLFGSEKKKNQMRNNIAYAEEGALPAFIKRINGSKDSFERLQPQIQAELRQKRVPEHLITKWTVTDCPGLTDYGQVLHQIHSSFLKIRSDRNLQGVCRNVEIMLLQGGLANLVLSILGVQDGDVQRTNPILGYTLGTLPDVGLFAGELLKLLNDHKDNQQSGELSLDDFDRP